MNGVSHTWEKSGPPTARLRRAVTPLARSLGSATYVETVVLLGAVLALDSADRASLGALAPAIKGEFHISNTDIGVLAAAVSIVGGLATVPIGALTDRVHRARLLSISIFVWSAAMLATGLAVTFVWLFAARMFLGMGTATGGPTVASLTGDLYPPKQRGRILSWIRSGELIGAGAGFLVAGAAGALFGWRGVFFALAIVGVFVAMSARRLPEPPRGSQGGAGGADTPADEALRGDVTGQLVHDAHVEPDPMLTLPKDVESRSLWWVVRYTLRVRTNVIVIIASSLGDFFFSGLQLFAVLFVVHQYGVGKYAATGLVPVVGIGALAGLLLSGHITDRLLARGMLSARVVVSAWSFIVGSAVLVPAFFTHSLVAAIPLFVIGAACLAAPNPPLDAARLDVIDPRLWGRAEGIRTVFRIAAQAIAPLIFGIVSDAFGGSSAGGLAIAFLLMIPTLLANGIILLFATRTYPGDVASAQASAGLARAREHAA